MHACGHDGHMAMLLTEAKILADIKKNGEGKIILMFEEADGGAWYQALAPLSTRQPSSCGYLFRYTCEMGFICGESGNPLWFGHGRRVFLPGENPWKERPWFSSWYGSQPTIECFVTICQWTSGISYASSVTPEESPDLFFWLWLRGGHEARYYSESWHLGTADVQNRGRRGSFPDSWKEIIEHIPHVQWMYN